MTRLRPDDYLGPYFVLAVIEKPTSESLSWAQLTFELTERVAILQPENPAPLSRGSIALVHLGRFEQAVSWMRRALVLDPDDPITCFNAACVYSVTGDPDAALHWLGTYVQQSAEDMIKLVENEPELAGLRNHPTYKELLTGWGARPPELTVAAMPKQMVPDAPE